MALTNVACPTLLAGAFIGETEALRISTDNHVYGKHHDRCNKRTCESVYDMSSAVVTTPVPNQSDMLDDMRAFIPAGEWWKRTVVEVGNIYHVYRRKQTSIHCKKVIYVEHLADFTRLQICIGEPYPLHASLI